MLTSNCMQNMQVRGCRTYSNALPASRVQDGSTHLARRVKQALQCVAEHNRGPQRQAAPINCTLHRLDNVRRSLKDVWPHKIQQVGQSVLAAQPSHLQVRDSSQAPCACLSCMGASQTEHAP